VLNFVIASEHNLVQAGRESKRADGLDLMQTGEWSVDILAAFTK